MVELFFFFNDFPSETEHALKASQKSLSHLRSARARMSAPGPSAGGKHDISLPGTALDLVKQAAALSLSDERPNCHAQLLDVWENYVNAKVPFDRHSHKHMLRHFRNGLCPSTLLVVNVDGLIGVPCWRRNGQQEIPLYLLLMTSISSVDSIAMCVHTKHATQSSVGGSRFCTTLGCANS